MSEQLPITDDARAYDTGTMELGVGESLSVAEALERMITLSDNTSAVMLGSRVGGQRINANLAALGMDTTHYSLERMTTSALDMVHLLDLIARGNAVSSSASADMIHLMLRQRVNDRLPRLLPDEVQVAHKTGNLPGIMNDVGILYGPSSTIAVAALVSDTSDETAAATGIARIALAAYSYFDELPEAANRPLLPKAPARAIPPVWREPRPVLAAPSTAQGTAAEAGAGGEASRQSEGTESTGLAEGETGPSATASALWLRLWLKLRRGLRNTWRSWWHAGRDGRHAGGSGGWRIRSELGYTECGEQHGDRLACHRYRGEHEWQRRRQWKWRGHDWRRQSGPGAHRAPGPGPAEHTCTSATAATRHAQARAAGRHHRARRGHADPGATTRGAADPRANRQTSRASCCHRHAGPPLRPPARTDTDQQKPGPSVSQEMQRGPDQRVGRRGTWIDRSGAPVFRRFRVGHGATSMHATSAQLMHYAVVWFALDQGRIGSHASCPWSELADKRAGISAASA
jgi:beta-lactamase class A